MAARLNQEARSESVDCVTNARVSPWHGHNQGGPDSQQELIQPVLLWVKIGKGIRPPSEVESGKGRLHTWSHFFMCLDTLAPW
jgi:hypothetical protein